MGGSTRRAALLCIGFALVLFGLVLGLVRRAYREPLVRDLAYSLRLPRNRSTAEGAGVLVTVQNLDWKGGELEVSYLVGWTDWQSGRVNLPQTTSCDFWGKKGEPVGSAPLYDLPSDFYMGDTAYAELKRRVRVPEGAKSVSVVVGFYDGPAGGKKSFLATKPVDLPGRPGP